MSKGVTLSKLEALLARIRTRAGEPRISPAPAATQGAATPIAVAPVAISPVVSTAPVAREVAVPAVPPPPPTFIAPQPDISAAPEPVDEPTLPPPMLTGSDQEFAVEVDMSEATGESLDVAGASAEDLDVRGPSASQERLAIADSLPPQSLSATDAEDVEGSVEPVAALADDESRRRDEDDDIEEAPISSRRAVVSQPEERLAQLAFGADEPPQRHTPPPKSGPLPAPPAAEFEADITGVRKTETLSIDEGMSAPSVLVPQATRPALASSADVLDVVGEAQSFAPATFVALLDASLSL